MEASSKIHSFPPLETTYLDGAPASSQLIEGTMCLVFFDSAQGDTVEKLQEVSGISGEMTQLGVPVLGIIMDEDLDGARENLSDLNFSIIVYNDDMRAVLEVYDDIIDDGMVSVFTKDGGIYAAWSSDCSAGWLLEGAVCGFLCPFGWFQKLLHKIPGKKFSTRRFHPLTYLKYVILALFVIVLPMTVVNKVGMGDPWFWKWLHIVISNTKAFILGINHGLSKKYLQSYLDEYSFRFCRRNFGPAQLERLTLAVSLSLG